MEKYSFNAIAFSKNRSITYEIDICEAITQDCLVFEEQNRFSELCKTGCKNYNKKWSCPPQAPSFSTFSSKWPHLLILYFRAPLDPFGDVKNGYLRVKAANSMLKSRVDRFMRQVAIQYGKYISTGSCRMCKPCKLQLGIGCAHPDIMTYSFEALGINVSALVDHYFDYPLLWYQRKKVPPYTSVVCGLLSTKKLSAKSLGELYQNIINT